MAPPPSLPSNRAPAILIGYGLIVLMLLAVVVSLPFALVSMEQDVANEAGHTYFLVKPADGAAPTFLLHAQLINLSELEGSVQLRVSGLQVCPADAGCLTTTRIYFVSGLPTRGTDLQYVPIQETITFTPQTNDVNKVIRLPVTGDPIRYPFDQYRLNLILWATTVAADGTETPAEPLAGAGLLNFSVENRTPRVKLGTPQEQHSPSDNHQFIQFIDTLTLSRPLYLQVLASLLVMLVAAASAYAVFMRPLDQLIINAGALVLGVWGIRAILLGSGLTVVTLVDLSLTGVILFLLIGITVRTLQRLEARTGVYVLRPGTWLKTGDGATGEHRDDLETVAKALPEAAESARTDGVERRDSEGRPRQR